MIRYVEVETPKPAQVAETKKQAKVKAARDGVALTKRQRRTEKT